MDNIATPEARELLAQIAPQNQLKLRVFLIGLEERILTSVLSRIIRGTSREILHGHQLLAGFHKLLKQLHHIQPIILFPTPIRAKAIIEVEAVNVDDYFLCVHILFLKK